MKWKLAIFMILMNTSGVFCPIFLTGLNTSEPHDQAPHLDLAFLLPLVLPAGLDDHLDHHIVSIIGNFDLCQWDPA